MLTLTFNDPFGQRMAAYAQKLETSAQGWKNVESTIDSAEFGLRGADSDFRWAENAQRQASFDTPRTDSSWHGRDLQRHFRSGGDNVDRSERDIDRGQRGMDGVNSGVAEVDAGLAQLAQEMQQANDPRAAAVQQAIGEVDKAQGNFSGVDGGFRRFDSSGQWVDNAIFRADSPIWAIASDRPGVDVRHHAYRVGDSLRDIDRELRNMEWALRDAEAQGAQGHGSLLAAVRSLRTQREQTGE